MSYAVKIFNQGSKEYNQALQLRTEVLRKPLGLEFTPAELKKDEEDVHFGLFENGEIIACLTLTETDNRRVKMRQVAVTSTLQGKGFGKELSLAAEKYCQEKGFEVIFCHARKTAVPFYQKLGYKITSAEFQEVSVPHYVMEKSLK
jgi:predicted GNAT family N-acyltransferase